MSTGDRPSIFAELGVSDLPGLPGPSDQLFSSAEDWWNNACINWSASGWSLYAGGYKEAADALVTMVEQTSSNQDTFVYPVLFLYRQYLELQLKMILRTLRHLRDIGHDYPKGHKIDALWNETQSLILRSFPEYSQEEVIEAGRLIHEFAKADPFSTAFRYPVDNGGNPSLPGIRYINLRNVRDVMAKVAMLLDSTYSVAYLHLQCKLEMEREFRDDSF